MKIECSNIYKSFGKKAVLQGASFSAESGECIGIVGANGSGKSTLLSILAGVVRADRGEFFCDGHDLFSWRREREKLVGYIPQGTPLLEELSARDNLLLWYKKKDMEKELETGVLKMLGIDKFLKVSVRKMSGGMKKRLSIGCAVAKNPPILLLDEPMAALDLVCKKSIFDYLSEHKKRGGIAVVVTHDVLELELCDRVYLMKGNTLSVLEKPYDVEKIVESLG